MGNFITYRCVAQLGRALRSGRRGRRFKSCRIDSLAGAPESRDVSGFPVLFLSVNNVGNIGCKALFYKMFYKTSKSNSSAALDDIDKNSRLFG